MTQRTMLILAATLSVFLTALVGGLAARLTAQSVAPPAPEAALDPTAVQALLAQRDQSYQQSIREANERLQQANTQLAQSYEKQRQLAAQLDQASAQQAGPAQPQADAEAPSELPAPTYAVSPNTAVAIATSAAPGASLTRPPELVDFQGVVAYEVALDRGLVYVDANSGQVLSNGAAVTAASGDHGREHEHDEHERDEHEGGEHGD